MNTPRFVVTLARLITAAGFVAASAAAQAGGNNVYWSVNVDAPTQGHGRVSTSFSNMRHGGYGYREPVVYAPAPVVIQAPGRVYYRDHDHGPRWRGHRHGWRHHHHHHPRHGARIARKVHNGLARMHQDMADFHASRADAWSNRGWRDHRGYRDGYYGR